VEYLPADLSVQAEVRQLVRDIESRYPRLDVLVNNAGGFFHRRQESADGIEMNWALHVLGPFLLTKLLVPRLVASAPARVINVSSVTHGIVRLHPKDFELKRGYNRVRAYSHSKLAELLLTYEWARRLQGTGVTVNAADPGLVATNIVAGHGGRKWKPVQAIYNMLVASPEKGAETAIYLASSPEVVETTGQFFKHCGPVRSSPASYDEQASRLLWKVCMEMTGEEALA
jgi:NAD(P)-dependent dehydrogenase (short-subunit alcohol dehydrogenase family)